jgi:ribosomal protein S27AE
MEDDRTVTGEHEVIAMSLTCTQCGATVRNDLPRSKMPHHLVFIEELRALGWSITPTTRHENNQRCPKCASSS